MPINAGYEYFAAEKKYLAAQTIEDKIACLEEMIRAAPKHKSSENFVANLKQRLNKLIEKKEKTRKTGKGTKKSIRKEGFQVILVGPTNAGKSSLLTALTNARPRIDSYQYTTKQPEVGTLEFEGIKAQIIDMPSTGSERFDPGMVHTADALLIVIESLEQLKPLERILSSALGKKIVVYNKSDLLSENELRKLDATFRSKKISGLIVSAETGYNLTELKRQIINHMDVVRIYTKEPGKSPAVMPVVLDKGATVKDVAEKIATGFSKKVDETRVTGPSSKFPNQKVGLQHIVKDKDVVEFHTR